MKSLYLTINNKDYSFLVDEHETLVKVIREKAMLTGTKRGCEQGSCGACTVIADGIPIQSCIAPALKFRDAKITTIEGVSESGKLHALQQKFVAHGAVQCGYCTPGMIMTCLALIKEKSSPSEIEIKEALSGNLCRCTGYKKIIEAVKAYVKDRGNDIKNNTSSKHKFIKVGQSMPYIEAEEKVTGKAEYADDIYMKDALHCKFLRSSYPHAEIVSINTTKAAKLKGVKCIVTGKDIPVAFGVLPISQDETALAVHKTRYIGEIVAAVAADSEAIAQEACKLIKVTYKPLKAFFNIKESLVEVNDSEKIHSHSKHNNNIHKIAELRFGDQQEALQKSVYKAKMNFNCQGVTHAFTEPHAAVAYWDKNGLTITSATQVPHYLHRYLAKVLEMPMSQIRVIKPYLGGGFGGKSDPFPHEMIISWIAKKLKKAVKVRFSREEVFLSNHGRHPTEINMEMGMNKDVEFTVLDADIKIDGGAYGSFGVVTSYYNGVLLQAPYRLNNFGFITKRLYTNKPQCGAMRGHGAVNPRFAVETLIDDLAIQSKTDPCELRLKNFISENSTTVGEYRITSNGSKESLEKVMEQSDWKNKYGKLPFGQGIGVGCGFFISGSALPIIWNKYPQSVVHMKVDLDGRVLITSGASDIGQGSDTMLAMITADILGLSENNVAVVSADTMLTPIDLGSYSSRVTFMAGNAAKMAAEKLKSQILSAVAKNKGIDLKELNIDSEYIYSNDKSINLSWKEAVEIATERIGTISTSGYYNSPKLGGTFKGAGAGLSPSYSFGAVIAEVNVESDTGKIIVKNVWGAHDCGKAINPLAVEGQLEGSWHMGIGQVLSEEMIYHNGLLLNGNFLDYKIPTTLDTPDIHSNIIESIDPEGPFGAKECGEGALHPVIPAITNAIFDAIGVRVNNLPVKPEYILNELKKNKTK